jgi:hypothetical protein
VKNLTLSRIEKYKIVDAFAESMLPQEFDSQQVSYCFWVMSGFGGVGS